MNPILQRLAIVLCAAVLLACSEQESPEKPTPASLTREETGYFCGMIVEDHAGPKSQIFVAGMDKPLWFTTVRDGIAFTLLPEETRAVTIFYVTTMDSGEWQHPELGSDNWLEADRAWFVVESSKRGSMGAAEAIPFAAKSEAERFINQYGGRMVLLGDIPQSYILGSDTSAISK